MDSRIEVQLLIPKELKDSLTTKTDFDQAKREQLQKLNQKIDLKLDMLDQSQLLQTELTHQLYFNLTNRLSQQSSDVLIKAQRSRNFDNMAEILNQVRVDLESSWQYVSTDMPGEYLQCLPIPFTNNRFVIVQPICHKQIGQADQQLGLVKNPRYGKQNTSARSKKHSMLHVNYKSSKDRRLEEEMNIEAEGFTQEKVNQRQYSIISFWKYDQKAF